MSFDKEAAIKQLTDHVEEEVPKLSDSMQATDLSHMQAQLVDFAGRLAETVAEFQKDTTSSQPIIEATALCKSLATGALALPVMMAERRELLFTK